ncbi:hypothetical protein LXL04_039575 [Taraxacum kok-saghyz]
MHAVIEWLELGFLGVKEERPSSRRFSSELIRLNSTSAVTLQEQKFGMILGTEDTHQSQTFIEGLIFSTAPGLKLDWTGPIVGKVYEIEGKVYEIEGKVFDIEGKLFDIVVVDTDTGVLDTAGWDIVVVVVVDTDTDTVVVIASKLETPDFVDVAQDQMLDDIPLAAESYLRFVAKKS